MHQGNWTCSGCGGKITELPFEPRSTDGLKCRECHQKDRGGDRGGNRNDNRGGQNRGPRPDRPMVSGNWTCADCGGSITELPFTPRDTSNLKCRDCFKKN